LGAFSCFFVVLMCVVIGAVYMNNTLVSVVIPTFNGAKTIEAAILSVLSQSLPVHEIIVVDDGSTDATCKVVSRLPVKLVIQSNKGPAGARNSGVALASGNWIAFLDHDDSWLPEKNYTQVSLIEDGVDAIFCEKFPETDDLGFIDLFRDNFAGNPSGSMVKKSVISSLNGFDESQSVFGVDDYDFWLRFLFHGFKYKTTLELYNFTPADGHYSGNIDKMLTAEIEVLKKAAAYANLGPRILRRRVRERQLFAVKHYLYHFELSKARNVSRAFHSVPLNFYHLVAFLPSPFFRFISLITRPIRRLI
jgi:glycosyltransferase involved in cell wall biosynthesis